MNARPPLTILVAMGIAIGGAVVSSALDLWLIVVKPPSVGEIALLYLIFNLGRVGLNIWFLVGMWAQGQWAWRAAFTLVVMGAVFDFWAFALPFTAVYPDFGLFYVGQLAAPNADSYAQLTIGAWVHVVVIQAPILLLLWRTSSRHWVGMTTRAARI